MPYFVKLKQEKCSLIHQQSFARLQISLFLYQPESPLLEEPHNIENAPVILNTLQIHLLVRETEEDDKASIRFFGLSCNNDPV